MVHGSSVNTTPETLRLGFPRAGCQVIPQLDRADTA